MAATSSHITARVATASPRSALGSDHHSCSSGSSLSIRTAEWFKCPRKSTARKTDTSSSHPRCPPKLSGSCFGAYLRVVWSDLLSTALLGVLILSIYSSPIYLYNTRLLPILPAAIGSIPGTVLDRGAPVEFHYPQQKSPISDWACAAAALSIPMVLIAIFQLRVRSIWDLHAGIFGTLKAVGTT